MIVMDSSLGEDSIAEMAAYKERAVLRLADGREVVFWKNDILRALDVEAPDTPDTFPNATHATEYDIALHHPDCIILT